MDLKQKAIILRQEGRTYSEITRQIGVNIPKSTLSYWLKSIKLDRSYQNAAKLKRLKHLKKIRQLALTANKRKRANFLHSIRKKNTPLSYLLNKSVCKLVLSMLYLGEGSKWRSYRSLSLGNSDPEVIKTYLNLLRYCYDIDESRLRCRVMYRADQDLKKLERFWSRITGIPQTQFYKTKPDQRTVGKITKNKSYKGVCSVYYGSTDIQIELELIAKIILERGPWYSGNTHPWHG